MAYRILALTTALALGAATLGATPVAASGVAASAPSGTTATSAVVDARGHGEAADRGRRSSAVPTSDVIAEERRASYSTRLARAMNTTRRNHDLRPLKVTTPCLTDFARDWARHLARTGKFEHQDLGPILERCKLSRVGEILAKGSVTPKQMIRMWLDSPGHRRLLLDPGFRKAGVFAKRDRNGSWVGCIDFGRG